MNDFQQGIADEEAQDVFSGGFPQQTEGNEGEGSIRTVTASQATKQEQSNGTGAPMEEGTVERTVSSVYIANLQWWTTDADVERLCSTYGPVVNVNFLAERSNGKSKGVALVEFADNQAATRCKEGLSGCNIHGRTCVVTFPNQSVQRGYGGAGRYGYGHYERGRIADVRGRGRQGRGYGHGGYDVRPGMGMHMMGEMPGYMHEMGMMDMPPDVMPHMEGHMTQPAPGYVPPPPYPMPGGGGGYMHEEHYDQNPYFRRGAERWEHGMDQEDMAQKRQRPASYTPGVPECVKRTLEVLKK